MKVIKFFIKLPCVKVFQSGGKDGALTASCHLLYKKFRRSFIYTFVYSNKLFHEKFLNIVMI